MYGFQEITVDQLKEILDQGDGVTLVDVRSPAEVAQGMIAGAKHVPLHLLPMSVSGLEKEKPVVFYCLSGGRSAQASAFASAQGFGQVFNLRGGISAWVRQGYPIAREEGK